MFDRSLGSLGVRLALVCGMCLVLAMPLNVQASGNEVERTITRAYKDLLGRNPDQDGMRTYRKRMLDDNWSEQQVRDDLKKSTEYKSRNADLIIDRAYDDILGRKPDKSGRETYRNRIIKDSWSEKRVREDLKKSDEYKNR